MAAPLSSSTSQPEKALFQQGAFLQKMAHFAIDHTAVAIFWAELSGQLVAVNPAACNSTGYSEQELLQLSVWDIDEQTTESSWQEHVSAITQLKHITIESEHRHKDGQCFPVEVQICYYEAANQGLICGFATNISKRKSIENSYLSSLQDYQATIQTCRDGFWLVDEQGYIRECNQAYCEMSGYSRDEVVGKHINELDAYENPQQTKKRIERIKAHGFQHFETKHRRKDGSVWPVEIDCNHSSGLSQHFFAFIHQKYDLKRSQTLSRIRDKLSREANRGQINTVLTKALDIAEEMTGSSIGFFHFVNEDENSLSLTSWSSNTTKTMCSTEPTATHYSISEAGIWADSVRERRVIVHNDYASCPHKKGMPSGHPSLIREITLPIFRDGQILAVCGIGNKAADYQPEDVEALTLVADIAIDYVEKVQANQRLHQMAFYDALTGLPNRTLLLDRIHQAIANAKRHKHHFALCFIDLDGFKSINDTFGHDWGDKLLIEKASKASSDLRDGDTLARIGGDEFVLLLTNLRHEEEYQPVIKRLLQLIETPFPIENHAPSVSASIGITLYPIDNSDTEVLLRHADQAMYQAKAAGKNQYYLYDATRQQREQQKTSLRAAFKQALSDNALTLHYQPIVQLPSHQVIGCEALIRWQHPTQGLLYPEHFLHVIEHSDDDIQLGNWVLHQALKQLQQWQQQRLDLSLSINISGYHLQQDDFTAQLQQAASAYPDVSLDRLELEIIETTDISDFTKTLTTMNQCRELGVRFALDDFGNGYSSMVHIHRLPFSRLKVDCSLVANLLSSNRALEVVRSVAKLAELYQCELVAEGVESIEAAIIMMSLGCHSMQGFGISVPVPLSEFQQWFDSWHHHLPMSQIQPFDLDAEHAMLKLEKLSHTLWFERICQYLQEPDKSTPQDLNEYACTFNQWYEGIGKENYGDNDNYAFIPPKHRAVHDLAKELIACHKNGDTTKLRHRLSDFSALKDQLLNALDQLAQ